jgi:hypothetical protein
MNFLEIINLIELKLYMNEVAFTLHFYVFL